MKGRYEGLKFAKSLEKKLAGDPARRKRLREALASVSRRRDEARAKGADTSRLEGLLEEARGAIELNKLDRAEEVLTECEDQLRSLEVRSVEDEIRLAQSIIDDIERLGVDASKVIELKAQAEAAAQFDPEKARSLAHSAVKEGGRVRDAGVAEWLSSSEGLVSESERWGMDVSAFRSSLERARGLIEKGSHIQAVEIMSSLYEEVERQRRAHFRDFMARVTASQEEARAMGMDVSRWEAAAPRLRSLIDSKDYETAAETLRAFESEAAEFKASATAVSEEISRARSALTESVGMGLDVKEASARLEEAEAKQREGRAGEASAIARKVLDSLTKKQRKVSGEVLTSIQADLEALRKAGASVEAPEATIRAARATAEAGNYSEAFSLARRCLGELEALREGFNEFRRSMARCSAMMEAARARGVDIGAIESIVREAGEAGGRGDYAGAARALSSALGTLEEGMAGVTERDISYALGLIERADMDGINLENAESLALDAISRAEGGDFAQVSEAAAALERAVSAQSRAGLLAQEALERAQESVAEALMMGVEASVEMAKLERARQAFESGDYESSRYQAEDIIPSLRQMCRESLEKNLRATHALMEELGQQGAEFPRAEEYLRRARELLECGRFGAGQSYAVMALEEARASGSKFREAVDARALLEAMVERARGAGVSMEGLEARLSQVRSLMENRQYEAALSTSAESVELVERKLDEHARELCDRLAALVEASEGEGLSVEAERAALRRGRELLEADEAAQAAGAVAGALKALEERRLMHHTASETLQAAERRLNEAEAFGIPHAEMLEELEEATKAFHAGNYEEAVSVSHAVKEAAERLLSERAGAIVDGALKRLEEWAGRGLAPADLRERLEGLRESVSSGTFSTVLKEVRAVEAEAERRRVRHEESLAALARTQGRIAEYKGLGADASTAEDMLGLARFAAERGNYDDVLDYSRRAEAELEGTAEEALRKRREALGRRAEELAAEGVELSSFRKALEESARGLSGGRFREGLELLERLETELMVRRDQHRNTQKLLAAAEARIGEAVRSGVKTLEAQELLTRARRAASSGDYPGAVELAERARDIVVRFIESHQQTLGAIELAWAHIREAEAMGADIARGRELLEQSEAHFASRNYDGAMEKVVECEQELVRAQESLVQDWLSKARGAIDAAVEIGADATVPKELVSRAEGALQTREYEEAFEMARRAREEAAASQERHGAALRGLTELQKLVQGALQDRIRMEAFVEELERARGLVQRHEYERAMELIADCRKRAEERIALATLTKGELERCEASLRVAREIRADASKAEALLRASKEAFCAGDYEPARARAEACRVQLESAQRDAVWEELGPLLIEAEDAADDGMDASQALESLEKAGAALCAGDFRRALEMCRLSRDRLAAARLVTRESRAAIEMARAAVEEARLIDVEVVVASDLVSGALEAFSRRDHVRAGELARQAADEVLRSERALISQLVGVAEKAVAEAESWGIRSRESRDRLARAKSSMEQLDFKRAKELMEQCDESLTRAINNHRMVSEKMGHLTEALEKAAAVGVDVARFRERAARAEVLVSRGEYEQAIESYDKLLGDVATGQREHIAGLLQSARRAAEEAGSQGVDVGAVGAALDEARTALERGEAQRAFELIGSAEKKLESDRREHRRVQGLAVALEEAIKKVRGFGADTSEPEELLASARASLKRGAYAEAETALKTGSQALSGAQSRFMSQRLLKVEESLGYLEASGVRAPRAVELHREAEKLFRSQYYAEMLKTLQACEAEIQRASTARDQVEAALAGLAQTLSAMDSLGAEPSKVQALIAKSRDVATEGEYFDALSLLEEARLAAEEGMRAKVQELLQLASAAVDEGEAMGADTRGARQLLLDAQRLAEAGEYSRAVELSRTASEEGERRTAEHRRHLEMVAGVERDILEAEAGGLNVERFRRDLDSARGHLRSHEYQDCVAALERTKGELRTLLKQSSEARRVIAFCEAKVGAARRISAEVGSAEALLAEARAATEQRNFVKAFELATRCLRDLDSMQHAVVLGFLSDTELHLVEIEETGTDTTGASELLEVALEALNESEFEKAMELGRQSLELARKERAEHEASSERLKTLERSVKDFTDVGGDARGIEELLDQGRRALASHDHRRLEEVVRSGMEALDVILREFVSQRTRTASSFISEVEEMGASVARARDRLSRARGALECGDHKSALSLIEEAIHAAEESRRRHLELIEAAKGLQAMAKEASELGLDVSRSRRALAEVNEAVDGGLYDEAFRIIQEARAELEKGYFKQAEDALVKVEDWMRRARELGAQISAEERFLAETKILFSQGRFQQVLKSCRECQHRTEERINEQIAGEILKAEHLMSEAERTGVDFREFKVTLERSEEAVSEGRYEQALQLARETIERGRATLRSSVGGTIETLRAVVEEARKMGADVREAEEVLRMAATALHNEEFSSAHDQALSGIALVDRIREEHLARRLSIVERRIREAEEMGVVVEDLLKSLEMARGMLEKSEFERASGLMAEVEKAALSRQSAFAEEVIKKAEETLSKVKMDIDLTKARSTLEEARAALSEGEYEEAVDYANRSIEEAGRAQRQFVEEVIATTEESIAAAREMGADPGKAAEALEWARSALEAGSYEGALEKAVQSSDEAERAQREFVQGPMEYCRKVLKEARIKDERLKNLLASAERYLAEKEYALARREVLRALGLTEEVQEKLALKEISTAEEVLARAEEAGARSPTARALLTSALKALDSRDYESATRLARECAAQAGRNKEDFGGAERGLAEVEESAAALKALGMAPEELLDFLEIARAEFAGGNYTRARELAAHAKGIAEATYVTAAREALSASQFKINYAKNIGADVSSAEKILAEARQAHDAREFGKSLELARKCREEAELAKERYKELVDTIYSAESKISVAHTYGLDTSSAERLLAQAVALKSTSGEEALDFARQSMEEVQRSLERFTPEITVDIRLDGPLHRERWSQATLSVANSGRATAKDIAVRFTGDLEVQGLERAPILRAGETRKQAVRLRPTKGGELPLTVTTVCLREFDGKEFKSHETRWIRVEDMTPLATPVSQFVTKSVRCHICLGTIKSGLPLVRCECSKTYHETCASRVGECPNCGRDLKNVSQQER